MIETMLLATGSHEPAPPIPKQIEYSAPGTYTVIVVAEMLPMHIVATGAGGGGVVVLTVPTTPPARQVEVVLVIKTISIHPLVLSLPLMLVPVDGVGAGADTLVAIMDRWVVPVTFALKWQVPLQQPL